MFILYIIIGLIVGSYVTVRSTARILNYFDGKAIAVYGSSEEAAIKRAHKQIDRLKEIQGYSREKLAVFIAAGFVLGLVAWFLPVIMFIVFRHHVHIQNGKILP